MRDRFSIFPYLSAENQRNPNRLCKIGNWKTFNKKNIIGHSQNIMIEKFAKRIQRNEENLSDFEKFDLYFYWKIPIWSELRKKKPK